MIACPSLLAWYPFDISDSQCASINAVLFTITACHHNFSPLGVEADKASLYSVVSHLCSHNPPPVFCLFHICICHADACRFRWVPCLHPYRTTPHSPPPLPPPPSPSLLNLTPALLMPCKFAPHLPPLHLPCSSTTSEPHCTLARSPSWLRQRSTASA